jgi:integrase
VRTGHDTTREGNAVRRERVVRLTRAGHLATDIAFIMGVTCRTVTRTRAAAELTVDYVRPPAPTEDQLLAGKLLLVDGASYPEVARTQPRWKDVPLRDIEFADMQAWISGLSVNGSTRFEGKGLSASRIHQTHQLVGAVLNFAVKSKHLAASPAAGIELPRKPETEQRYLTHEQLHRLAVASGRFRTQILVMGYCGLRFGEAAALRVGDVDLTARRVRVRRSVTEVAYKGMVEGPTKNHTSRTVPVPRFLVPLLTTEIGDRPDDDLLFPSRRGGYLTLGEFRWGFNPAAKAISVEGLHPHELRHTCASLAIKAGANVKVLQTLLGHKTATLTLDRYGHLFPDDLGRIADAFDAAVETTADDLRTIAPLRAVSSD